jgi:hypothetical protein
VHVFTLPATFAVPNPRLETFEGSQSLTPSAGSQFTVAGTSRNHFLRQSSLAGDAHAVMSATTWVDQGIEAEIRPLEFNGADRWVGLATRYSNPQNYYYVTLRNSGTVQLRRMRNGTYTTLATAPLALTLNRTYRVRLESIGTAHRVYVDGVRVLDVDDAVTGPAGDAAIVMYRARADYDNLFVTSSPRTTLFANDFSTSLGYWKTNGPGQWSLAGSGRYTQGSVTGDARSYIGTPNRDQVVSARVRPIAYSAPQGTQERWVGVIGRYVDERNYYYLTLRSGGTLSLRKLVNGTITELASAPQTVTVGNWYSVRLELLANSLRAYVNNTLVLQVRDNAHTVGVPGLVTYKAAAEFDDFVAYQP